MYVCSVFQLQGDWHIIRVRTIQYWLAESFNYPFKSIFSIKPNFRKIVWAALFLRMEFSGVSFGIVEMVKSSPYRMGCTRIACFR